jgi:hypothetical protein
MAGLVLNSSSVFQLNFGAKLKFCASISATSPSRETLCVILQQLVEKHNVNKNNTPNKNEF